LAEEEKSYLRFIYEELLFFLMAAGNCLFFRAHRVDKISSWENFVGRAAERNVYNVFERLLLNNIFTRKKKLNFKKKFLLRGAVYDYDNCLNLFNINCSHNLC